MFIFFDSSFFIFPFVQARFLHIHIHTRTSVTSVTSVTSKRLSITRTTHTCDSVSYTRTRTVKKMFFFFILVLYSRQPCSLSVFLFYSCPVPRCAQHAQWPLPLQQRAHTVFVVLISRDYIFVQIDIARLGHNTLSRFTPQSRRRLP